MKKILLLIAAPFAFLFALSAQTTQEEADAIVLKRLSQETLPYIVSAKEDVQTSMTVSTANGETLELDYKCWVYYVSYIDFGRYLIVNESNGNLLEVNAKDDKGLATWKTRVVGRNDGYYIDDGIYSGTFTVEYFMVMREGWSNSGTVTLELKNGKYTYTSDVPPILFSGTYSISNGKIIFDRDIEPEYSDLYKVSPYFDINLWLNGEYDYIFDGKRLKFSATKGYDGHYEYNLEKQEGEISNCDQNVIISADEYENAPDDPLTIIDMKIVNDCLKIKLCASGCGGNSWNVKLIGLGNYDKSNPPQTTLRLSLDNKEDCTAVIGKEVSFNLEPLKESFPHHDGTNQLLLNISGKSILYEYEEILWNDSKIAFIVGGNNGHSLYTMDISGNNMQKIVDKIVACHKPVHSYFGTKLLFPSVSADNSVKTSYEYGLYVVNTDGTDLTSIDRIGAAESGSFGSAAWSPDDRQIIYVKYSGVSWENRDLIRYNISDNTRKTLQTEGTVCTPKFSPDGRHIVYCAEIPNDNILYIHTYHNHHIYKMDVNGQNNCLIIKEGASPKYSPQGDKIAYLTTGQDGSSQISVANADGSGQKELTSSVSPYWYDTGFPRDGNGDPQWTPDGEKIVYVSYESGKAEIFIMNVDGSNKTRLSDAEFRGENPAITPDGKYILFTSRRPSNIGLDAIYIMDLDGKNQRMLYGTGSFPVPCK